MREAISVPYFGASLKEWFFTTDHKKIGILYFSTAYIFFLVAGLFGLVIRLEQNSPGIQYVQPDIYNYLLTGHGAVMLLWWAIASHIGGLGNFLLPLMIGAKDVAFPRLNALSWWAFFGASVLVLLTLIPGNHIMMMWTGYPPYATTGDAGVTALYVFIIHLVGVSSIATAVNFITTYIKMRAPGINFWNTNMFVHCLIAANVIQLIGVPSLAGAVTMLLLDRYLGTNFYNPSKGGDPLLYQNVFWFYSHPVVYVQILPVFGIFSEIVPTFARRPLFGYKSMIFAVWGITLLSFEVWIHHMFVSGVPDWARVIMSYTTILIAVPTGIKIFNWIATLHGGAIILRSPMLYALGGIFMFLIGGLTGIPNAMVAIDLGISDSLFIVGHFHYVLGMAVTLGVLGAVIYWFPKMTGRMYPEGFGKLSFWLVFIGANLFYFFQMVVGMLGNPRRYPDYPPIPEWVTLHHIQTVGAMILGLGVLVFTVGIIKGLLSGEKAPDNPWQSQSLEWQIPSPAPVDNFGEEHPKVEPDYHPYKYGAPPVF